MSGHSKWAQIKRKKAVADAKKGAVFTKVAKNITVAAKKGKDPEANAALRAAIDQARTVNMPKENIEKAILKGTGELPGVSYEEVLYEGYGPGGVALIMEGVTDNTNRTVSDLRRVLSEHGGSLGQSGSVLYMFKQKGVVRADQEALHTKNIDEVELAAIDAGAEDIQREPEGLTIITGRAGLTLLLSALKQQNITPTTSGIEWITTNYTELSSDDSAKLTALLENLEVNEDINNVYTNANIK